MINEEIDDHKLMYHPERVSEWLRNGDCFPMYIEIGLTNVCNHNCVFCNLDWVRGKAVLDTSTLLINLKDMAIRGVKSICYSGGGEPLLHPDFPLIIKETKKLGIDVSFSTNTVLFNEEIAEKVLPYTSWIRFSVDAASSESHAKIHGTSKQDFNKIIDNIKNAVKIKKENKYDTTLGVQFLLIEENASEVLEMAALCKKLGVDNLQIKPYSENPNSFTTKIDVEYQKFMNLKDKLEPFSTSGLKVFFRLKRIETVIKGLDYNTCLGLPFFTILTEKGNIQPCFLYYDTAEFSYGNIYDNTFSEIWQSKRRKEVLNKIKQAGTKRCIRGCRLDMINKYLYRLKNPHPHENFI